MAEQASTDKDFQEISDEVSYEELKDAIRHFDRVMRSQMTIQGLQGDRIKNSIRAGMIFLALIGISIFIILITMVTQVEQIAMAVSGMDTSFDEVRNQMVRVDALMSHMETNASKMNTIGPVMQTIDGEMLQMTQQVQQMQSETAAMGREVSVLRQQADLMAQTTERMDMEIYRMNHEVNRMATPARSMNNMFPMP
ncbi:MAG: hypothetical protein OQK25_04580 [Gammaproteobacteria bacterium]|nr:hypothetical protein [Gammaproteobacteria bacterium]